MEPGGAIEGQAAAQKSRIGVALDAIDDDELLVAARRPISQMVAVRTEDRWRRPDIAFLPCHAIDDHEPLAALGRRVGDALAVRAEEDIVEIVIFAALSPIHDEQMLVAAPGPVG